MTFSEFGRRVAENGSAGTDHGEAAPLFVIGSHVKAGIHGPTPDLRKQALFARGRGVQGGLPLGLRGDAAGLAQGR